MTDAKNELRYSQAGLKVKARFYNRKAMVYVEGPEDLNFWSPYFDNSIFKIESVGGCKNLASYINDLENGIDTFIVACDADYTSFIGSAYSSDLIVTTYGHSIENMMYCPHNLNEVVKILSKSLEDTTTEIESWYEGFVKAAHPLLLREICNLVYKPKEQKITVFGNSSARFCKTKPCYELDESIVEKFCRDNAKHFPEAELKKIETAISKDEREERQLIKGHFLTHAISRLVENLAKTYNPTNKKANVPHDYLYSLSVKCEDCKIDACIEKTYLYIQVTNAIKHLNYT